MSLRFVISDVDGTLVNRDKKLTQPTIDAKNSSGNDAAVLRDASTP